MKLTFSPGQGASKGRGFKETPLCLVPQLSQTGPKEPRPAVWPTCKGTKDVGAQGSETLASPRDK